ncbi:MAG: ATP-binding protein [Thermoanaerobaculia bacterium]
MTDRPSLIARYRRLDHAQRFAVTALVSVLGCAVLFGWLLEKTIHRAVESNDQGQTAAFVRHVIATEFGTGFFQVKDAIRDPRLGNRFLKALALDEVFRIKVYNLEGRIIWSDEPELLGVRFPDNMHLARSLSGRVESVIETPERTEHLFERGRFEKIMESYIPIFEQGSVVGVVEIYRYPRKLFKQIRQAAVLVWSASLGLGALLYVAMVGVVRRINRTQRRLENELRRSADELVVEKSKLERIVNAVGAGLILADSQGRILWANEMAECWFGGEDGLVGASAPERFCRDCVTCVDCPFEASAGKSTGPVHCEHVATGLDGERRTFQIITTPESTNDAVGEADHFLQLILDVTESKEVEEQLRQADKMAVVGQLAAGIAHQINNPVGILLTTITHRREFSNDRDVPRELRDDLEMMERQCRRIDQSVRSLLSFSRKPEGIRLPVDLKLILDEAILLTQPRMKHASVNLETDFDARPCVSVGDPNDALQLILNLINNAIDAMPKGGSLKIQTTCQHNGTEADLILRITDTGTGLPKGDSERLFEPFFTTKEIGRGTGLGLAVSKRIVESFGGEIRATNNDSGGASFEIRLPEHKDRLDG